MPACFLLVTDDGTLLDTASDCLGGRWLGDSVYVAEGAAEAWDYLSGRDHFHDRERYPVPDVIVLDLGMAFPERQRLLERIKASPGLERIPVLNLCSSRHGIDTTRYDAGADGSSAASVTLDGFLDAVRQLEKYWDTPDICGGRR